MRTTAKPSWFAPKLRAALDRPGSPAPSVRALARTWRPADVENARRSLIRYLQNGIVPNPVIRRELEAALGMGTHELDPDEDEEAATEMAADLTRMLQQLVRTEVARRDRERVPA